MRTWNFYTAKELHPEGWVRRQLEIQAEVKRIPGGLEGGYTSVCAKVPQSKIPLSGTETVELYPYGCAKLRMTKLPLL